MDHFMSGIFGYELVFAVYICSAILYILIRRERKARQLETARKWARKVMRRALANGAIVRPANCENCGDGSYTLHGHHWHGYFIPYALDVIWLCPACHKGVHTGRVTLADDPRRIPSFEAWMHNPVTTFKTHRSRLGEHMDAQTNTLRSQYGVAGGAHDH